MKYQNCYHIAARAGKVYFRFFSRVVSRRPWHRQEKINMYKRRRTLHFPNSQLKAVAGMEQVI